KANQGPGAGPHAAQLAALAAFDAVATARFCFAHQSQGGASREGGRSHALYSPPREDARPRGRAKLAEPTSAATDSATGGNVATHGRAARGLGRASRHGRSRGKNRRLAT